MGLITYNENLKTVVWVNGEPVKFIPPNSSGIVPLSIALKSGDNEVFVTTESSDGSEGTVNVEVKEGHWREPEKIKIHFKWDSKKANDKSPAFSYKVAEGNGEDFSSYDDIEPKALENKNEILKSIYEMLKSGLEKRSLAEAGIDKNKLNLMASSLFKTDDFVDQVFNSETYKFSVISKIETLEVIKGKKTLLFYNPTGEKIFEAGPEPNSDGTVAFTFFVESIRVAKKNGQWHFIF